MRNKENIDNIDNNQFDESTMSLESIYNDNSGKESSFTEKSITNERISTLDEKIKLFKENENKKKIETFNKIIINL